MTTKQPSYLFSAWENYKEWESTCPECNWTGLLAVAIFDSESDLVSALLCPRCKSKLALMSNEATHEDMPQLAAQGNEYALNHVATCERCKASGSKTPS